MYTSTKIIVALLIVLITPVRVIAVDTETVGSNTYTHIQTCWDRADIFANRTALGSAGFGCNISKISLAMGDMNLIDDIASCGYYGGVLLWASHGGPGWVACEGFPDSEAGQSQAIARANMLMAGASFQAGDLDVHRVYEVPCFAVALTNQGISHTFVSTDDISP